MAACNTGGFRGALECSSSANSIPHSAERRSAEVCGVRDAVGADARCSLTLADTLQQFVAGESCSAARLTSQDTTMKDATSSLRGGSEVRLRAFILDGHVIPEPANGSWYQTSQAVKILCELKESKRARHA